MDSDVRPRAVLHVRGLRIETAAGTEIVDEVTFQVRAGEVLALVGESGCGKTSTAHAVLGHARAGLRIAGGSVRVGEVDVLQASGEELRRLRGARVAYVPQDASTALNPRRRVGTQLIEALTVHGCPAGEARAKVLGILAELEFPNPLEIVDRYPFELSGGQQQRILIAMAVVGEPEVVVMDEPTTGLDVTTQAEVLKVLQRLVSRQKSAFVYVTHDLAVVQQVAHRVAVMYAGRIIESGPIDDVFDRPAHPYTAMLLGSVPLIHTRRKLTNVPGMVAPPGERPQGCSFHPRCPLAEARCREKEPAVTTWDDRTVRCLHRDELHSLASEFAEDGVRATEDGALLEVAALTAGYRGRSGSPAVDGVSFAVFPSECVALVGESGSGKSTLGRCIAGLHAPSRGRIELFGQVLAPTADRRTKEQRRLVQVVFQNPHRSLNPSHTVEQAITRPLQLFGMPARAKTIDLVCDALERVHLPRRVLHRYPRELSGGEKQRVAIARAIAINPELLVCDEVTSALDVSIQAAIITLLHELLQGGIGMLFITHNLGVVNSLADRVLVMRDGRLQEEGPRSRVLGHPESPYTRALMAAAPELRTPVTSERGRPHGGLDRHEDPDASPGGSW